MSQWQEYNLEEKITQILSDVPDYAPDHHLGRPFLTAYQIAIEFAHRYPEDFARLGFPVGGIGIGQRSSLAQYLAKRLSDGIKAERITHIAGSFLSNQHLNDIYFDNDGESIRSSLTSTQFTLSMFRLRDV